MTTGTCIVETVSVFFAFLFAFLFHFCNYFLYFISFCSAAVVYA